ncbi:hypothetical protein QL285_025902 [Trifolium repens]|nr:hypothetical protein QL285_025902 [Trifolium repens]
MTPNLWIRAAPRPHPPENTNIRRKNINPNRSEPKKPRSVATTYRHGEEAQRTTVAREYRKHNGKHLRRCRIRSTTTASHKDEGPRRKNRRNTTTERVHNTRSKKQENPEPEKQEVPAPDRWCGGPTLFLVAPPPPPRLHREETVWIGEGGSKFDLS